MDSERSGASRFSLTLSDENRASSISIRFLELTEPTIGKSLYWYSHDPIFWNRNNRVRQIGSCERALKEEIEQNRISLRCQNMAASEN